MQLSLRRILRTPYQVRLGFIIQLTDRILPSSLQMLFLAFNDPEIRIAEDSVITC